MELECNDSLIKSFIEEFSITDDSHKDVIRSIARVLYTIANIPFSKSLLSGLNLLAENEVSLETTFLGNNGDTLTNIPDFTPGVSDKFVSYDKRSDSLTGNSAPANDACDISTHDDAVNDEEIMSFSSVLMNVYRMIKRGVVPDGDFIEYLYSNMSDDKKREIKDTVEKTIQQLKKDNKNLSTISKVTLAYNSITNPQEYGMYTYIPETAYRDVHIAKAALCFSNLQKKLIDQYLPSYLKSYENISDYIQQMNESNFCYKNSLGKCLNSYDTIQQHYKSSALNPLLGDLTIDQDNIARNQMTSFFRHLMKANFIDYNSLSAEANLCLSGFRTSFIKSARRFRRQNLDINMLKSGCLHRLRQDMQAYAIFSLEKRVKNKNIINDLGKQILTKLTSIEYKRIQEVEKQRRNRLKALRENDLDSYINMIKQVKNARILAILENTERLLQDIGAKLQIETNDVFERELRAESLRAQKMAHKLRKKYGYGSDIQEPDDSKPQQLEGGLVTSDGNNGSGNMESEFTSNTATTARKSDEARKVFSINNNNMEKIGQPKSIVGGQLMPHQLAGLGFLVNLYNNGLSCILADEMGLGKTIQTISFLAYLLEVKRNPGPHLITVPLSTLPNWTKEFEKWCPSLKVIQYRGTRDERRLLRYEINRCRFNVLLTTFEYVLREKAILSKLHWRFIIVDEGHKMKNSKSKFHITLAEFFSTNRLLITGTPLQNNLNELWTLLNFLMPKTFNSSEDFEKWFEEPFKDHFDDKQDIAMTEEEKMVIINRLHLVLRPFLLRRVKADVLQDLPSKQEYIVRICLSSYQEFLYERLVNKCLTIRDLHGKATNKSTCNGIMQLRKAVNHPYLFVNQYFLNADLIRTSGKIETLDRMLIKLLKFNHKVLIFSQMTSFMDILSDYFAYRQFDFYRLDGSMLMQERQARMDEFNDENSKVKIFMLSTRAGGLGLNLQAADTVILVDSDWNPHADLQAQARAHRVGQKREVRVYRFVTLSPVEESILSKAEYKLNLDERIIQAGMFSSTFDENEREERLRNLLAQKTGQSMSRATTPVELCKFLARSDEEHAEFLKMEQELFGQDIWNQFEIITKTSAQFNDDSNLSKTLSEACDSSESSSKIGSDTDSLSYNSCSDLSSSYSMTKDLNKSYADAQHGKSLTYQPSMKSDDFYSLKIACVNSKIKELLEESGRLIKTDELPEDLVAEQMNDSESQSQTLTERACRSRSFSQTPLSGRSSDSDNDAISSSDSKDSNYSQSDEQLIPTRRPLTRSSTRRSKRQRI